MSGIFKIPSLGKLLYRFDFNFCMISDSAQATVGPRWRISIKTQTSERRGNQIFKSN